MEIASMIQVTVNGFLSHTRLFYSFLVSKKYIAPEIPYPDFNPENSSILFFYEGEGNAKFVFESYQFYAGELYPDGKFDSLSTLSNSSSFPSLSLVSFAMIFLVRKKNNNLFFMNELDEFKI